MKWLNRFRRLKFDQKMKMFTSICIVVTTTIILIISTVSFALIARNQSRDMAEEQLYSMASNYEATFANYKELAIALIMDTSIQNYLVCDKNDKKKYYGLASTARNTLLNTTNVNSNINFIAVINEYYDDYIYKGYLTISNTKFYKNYKEDYIKSKHMDLGAMQMSFNNSFSRNGEYSLNIYYPVFSTRKIDRRLGLLCLNIRDNNLAQIFTQNNNYFKSQIQFIDNTGAIVAVSDEKLIGTKVGYIDHLTGFNGSFTKSGNLYIYQKIKNWNYYLIQIIPNAELAQNTIRVMMLLVFIMVGMVIISLFILRKFLANLCRPFDEIVHKMEVVSKGQLDVRMKEENDGEDFKILAVGFNSMMEELDILMEQIKLEQQQLEQTRFNALQSQIKPHFLYNTLDCIHWQAVADGNKEISTLVKALASYYRICLSKGEDIISLSQEIVHIENYLIIQNMRYDNIIESEIRVGEEFLEIQIPKMTLQPLVENAIYHGIKVKEGEKGKILITAGKTKDFVIVEVMDSGSGMTEKEITDMNNSISETDQTFGYGVRNVNKRIEIMFGEKYGLFFIKNEKQGVTVQIRLPLGKNVG